MTIKHQNTFLVTALIAGLLSSCGSSSSGGRGAATGCDLALNYVSQEKDATSGTLMISYKSAVPSESVTSVCHTVFNSSGYLKIFAGAIASDVTDNSFLDSITIGPLSIASDGSIPEATVVSKELQIPRADAMIGKGITTFTINPLDFKHSKDRTETRDISAWQLPASDDSIYAAITGGTITLKTGTPSGTVIPTAVSMTFIVVN